MKYQIQEYLFGWYDLKDEKYNTETEAKKALLNREKKRIKSNKKCNNFNIKGYSKDSKRPTKIIEIS